MQANNRKATWDKSDSRRRRGKRNMRGKTRVLPSRLEIYSAAGRQALRDLQSLRRFINTEMHFTDVTNTVSSSNTPTLVLLNGLSLGDTSSTRTGQSIKMDRLDLRFQMSVNTTSVANFIRIIVVVDKQTNASAMTAADLLASNSTFAPYSQGCQMRFIPLYDESFALNSAGPGSIIKCVTLRANQHVMFNTANNGTVADIVSNSLYLIHLSDQSTNTPQLSYYSRLWFVDN